MFKRIKNMAWWIKNGPETYEFNLGIHSGFPRCCVWYWSLIWQHIRVKEVREDGELVAVFDPTRMWILEHIYDRFIKGRDVGYIQCPLCLIRGRVEPVHHCIPDSRICFPFDPNRFPK